jgi:protoheme IX farnesyltransferase
MPPVLGWAAMVGDVPPEAWTLFLIIFIWTPPHFWALALYRIEDYKKSGLPMLPVTHGSDFTRLQMVLYTILLVISTILPYSIHLAGMSYLFMVLLLNAWFLYYIMKLYRQYSDQLSKKTFFVSIWYLFGIFAALIIDKALLLLF